MALIPITFKADIEDNPKGNIRPEDLAALFSFLYKDTAGILNITGQDCSYLGAINVVGNQAQVTFNSGYIVVFGRAAYIEQGTQVAFNLPSSGSVSGVIGIKIDLAQNGTSEVTWFQKPTQAITEDLLKKSSDGVYEFVLYNYTATPNTMTLDNKTSQIINNVPATIEKKFETLTQTSTSRAANGAYMTLTLYKDAGSRIVYGSLDGVATSRKLGIECDFSFNINEEFRPSSDITVFNTTISNNITTMPVIFAGATGSGNDIYISVSNSGILKPDGSFSFTTYGWRPNGDTSIVLDPIHYTFVYLAKE